MDGAREGGYVGFDFSLAYDVCVCAVSRPVWDVRQYKQWQKWPRNGSLSTYASLNLLSTYIYITPYQLANSIRNKFDSCKQWKQPDTRKCSTGCGWGSHVGHCSTCHIEMKHFSDHFRVIPINSHRVRCPLLVVHKSPHRWMFKELSNYSNGS